MSGIGLLARHEWRRLAAQPFAWILAAVVLALMSWQFLLALQAYLEISPRLGGLKDAPGVTDLVAVPLLHSLANVLAFVVPLLTMRMIAGERRAGTLPLLLASGLSPTRIVLGKYLAVLGWLALWLALALAMPLSLAHGTTLDWGKLAAAALGLALLLALLAAIGLACSTFASHPAIAATASLVITLTLCCVNLGAQAAGVDNGAIHWLALGTHLEPLLRGLVATDDVLWFVLLAALALALAIRRLGSDRERG